MVKERETRWLRLDESRGRRVQVPDDVGSSYELEDGVFLITAREEVDSAEVLTVDVRNTGVERTESGKKETAADVWDRFALTQNVINFIVALDDNDLFAFATKCVSLF